MTVVIIGREELFGEEGVSGARAEDTSIDNGFDGSACPGFGSTRDKVRSTDLDTQGFELLG
jgi:hypothetical protein